MRRKPSIATILSFVAMFFALSGGAFAATHFAITSMRQISPKVRHQLANHAQINRLGQISQNVQQRLQPIPFATQSTGTIPASGSATVTAKCPAQFGPVFSGGYSGGSSLTVTASVPSDAGLFGVSRSWSVTATNSTGVAQQLTVYAVCEL